MSLLIDKFLWSGMVALGLQFLYMGIKIRFDKAYTLFGVNMLLLSVVFANSIISPNLIFPFLGNLVWIGILILSGLIFCITIVHFFMQALGIERTRSVFIFAVINIFLGITTVLVLNAKNNYSVFLFVLLLFEIFVINIFIIKIFWRAHNLNKNTEKIPMIFLGIGWIGFCIFIAADMTRWALEFLFINFSLLGAGFFTTTGVYFLMNRFFSLYHANKNSLYQLATAYVRLNDSVKHKELGTSALSITHEIRNYAASLKGNVFLMNRKINFEKKDLEYQNELERIASTADKMEKIAKDVASFAISSSITQSKPIDLEKFIHRSVSASFPDQFQQIEIQSFRFPIFINGDEFKLDQVFHNLIKNAWEANAESIVIRCVTINGKVIIAIEDDGIGCSLQELESISKPFYTTKQNGGTGLGGAIAESILKSHNGSIRYYSKNVLGEYLKGLIVNLVIPIVGISEKSLSNSFSPIYCFDYSLHGDLIQPIINLGMQPLVSRHDDLFIRDDLLEKGFPIIMDIRIARTYSTIIDGIKAAVIDENRTVYSDSNEVSGESTRKLYSEEWLSNWIKNKIVK